MCVIEENDYLKVFQNLRGLLEKKKNILKKKHHFVIAYIVAILILTVQINLMKPTSATSFPPPECWLSSPALFVLLWTPLLSSHCHRFICELAPYRPTGHLEPVALWLLGRVKYGN